MDKNAYVEMLKKAQREFNGLLIGAYQYNLKCTVSITKLTACSGDDRTVVGLKIVGITDIYNDNGDV